MGHDLDVDDATGVLLFSGVLCVCGGLWDSANSAKADALRDGADGDFDDYSVCSTFFVTVFGAAVFGAQWVVFGGGGVEAGGGRVVSGDGVGSARAGVLAKFGDYFGVATLFVECVYEPADVVVVRN